jgi:hypothetical protein
MPHFGCLTADQCTFSLNTSVCNSFDNACYFIGIIFSARNVIQKIQRLGSVAQNIIDTHIATKSCPTVSCLSNHLRNHQFRSDTVRAGNKKRADDSPAAIRHNRQNSPNPQARTVYRYFSQIV